MVGLMYTITSTLLLLVIGVSVLSTATLIEQNYVTNSAHQDLVIASYGDTRVKRATCGK